MGPAALDCKPGIEQIFIKAPKNIDQNDFERKLYLVRKIFTKKLRQESNLSQALMFYA